MNWIGPTAHQMEKSSNIFLGMKTYSIALYQSVLVIVNHARSETHQLGANLEDAVDVLPGPASFGPTLGEAGELAEQWGRGEQGELGGQGGEKVFLELGTPRWAFFFQWF